MKYHVFFTTQYTDECLRYRKFGATSVNSLGNVHKGDFSFLFDGLRWKIYGPLEIISDDQFYDITPIYGKNKRGIINYPNRINFSTSMAKALSFSKLFSLEKDMHSNEFLTNRILQSVIIANKQVHSTQLTEIEGQYLKRQMYNYGEGLTTNTINDLAEYPTVIDNFIKNRKTKSEALFELLLLKGRYNKDYFDLSEYEIFNQFVLGFQRQTDIIAVNNGKCLLIEIKKKDNQTDPFEQINEYSEYIISDSRLNFFKIKELQTIALLENGNKFIKSDENCLVFEMNSNYKLEIASTLKSV